MINPKDITVIVPVFNEENNLNLLYNRLKTVLLNISKSHQILFVNDGSTDKSLAMITKIHQNDDSVCYINFTRNFGHQIAVSAGLEYSNAKAVVIIDADLQDPPELITKLYTQYKNGFDVVYAKRNKRKGESFAKKITARVFYRIFKRWVAFEMPLDAGDYRLISNKVVKALNTMPEQNKFIRGQIAWLGFKQTQVLYNRDSRQYGKSAYTYSKMFRLALDGITGFSDKPLLFVSRLGFIISIFSFLIILYAIFSHFFLKQTITGWTSLIISSAFIGGIQLLSIGIIGEYISRINSNSKQRPLYIVDSATIEKPIILS